MDATENSDHEGDTQTTETMESNSKDDNDEDIVETLKEDENKNEENKNEDSDRDEDTEKAEEKNNSGNDAESAGNPEETQEHDDQSDKESQAEKSETELNDNDPEEQNSTKTQEEAMEIGDEMENNRLREEPIDQEVDAEDFEVVEKESVGVRRSMTPRGRGRGKRGRGRSRRRTSSPKYIGNNRKPDFVYETNERSLGLLSTPSKQSVDVNPLLKLPFDQGWRRELVYRKPTSDKANHCDVYYFPPSGPKLRSMVQVGDYLAKIGSSLTVENFTFTRRPVFYGPFEVVRQAGEPHRNFQQKNKTTPKSKNSLTPGGSKVSTPNSAASTPGRDSGTGTPVRLDENKSVSIKLAPPGSGIPNVVMIQNSGQNSVQKVSGQRPAVAKKRTAPRVPGVKRLHVGPALSIEKKQKIEMSAPPALCGMECPGKEGIPPTMHCGVCMCLFHPECVTFTPSSSGDAYLCQTCQNVTGMKVPNTTGPQTSGLSNGNLSLRAPPPLTPMQAPYGNNSDTHKVVTGLPPPPTLTLASGVSTNLTSALPNVISTARPSNVAQTINVSQLANQQQVSAHVLTLPSSIQNRVNISSPLSIRVNNQNIIVPPSCLISTPMGIKVFLPPGIVTNAMNMSGGESSFRATNVLTNTSDPQKFTIKDIEQGGREPVVDLVNDAPQSRSSSNSPITIPEVKTLDKSKIRIRKTRTNKIDPSQCHFQKLHGGFDCMFSIFEFLSVSDLLRASRVCRVWRNIASQHSLWRNVHLRGCRVSDWEAAAKCFNNFHTQKLDMRGMDHVEGDKNRTWHQFTAVLGEITMLQHIHFGPCPGIILHSVAEKLINLRFLTAESISDATSEDQVWSSNTKLDIGKFKELKNLHELKLRGMGGLVMPAFSFSGGLPELSALTHLKRLSLTTLKDIPDSEFTFIGMLENLEELEMGDCSTWTETYAQLGNLQNLKRLRLECSGDSVDDKLAESLSKLKQLKTLELIKFVVTKSVCTILNNMTQLRVMKVWPDIGSQTASCNSQTMAAVSTMTFLEILEWGIMMDKSTTPDNSENNNGQKEAASLESIPFLPVGGSTEKEGEEAGKNGENVDLMPEYINIGQLMDKLCDYLPDTKIRVFKVPVFNAGRKGQ